MPNRIRQFAVEVLDLLDCMQYVTLKAIADLCPETGGKAVRMARSRLQIEYDHLDWDDSECFVEEEEEPLISVTDQEHRKQTVVQLFPNPTSSVLNVHIYNPHDEPINVQIMDIYGRNLVSFNVLQGQSISQVVTEEWPQGLYFLTISNLHFVSQISRRIAIVR